jgi:hypothetical protein
MGLFSAMPEPVKVWMARPGREDSLSGVLSLVESILWFEGSGTTIRVEAADIMKVRRARGSPVITVAWAEEGERREAAFYFVKPGPLGWSVNPPWMPGRGLGRTFSLLWLREANRQLKPLVKEWTEAIRRAAGAKG